MRHSKLVRDGIPEIIRKKGGKPKTHTATGSEYWRRLKDKLVEEAQEFNESEEDTELADILEVVRAICEEIGLSWRALDTIRHRKARERGSFKKRIILEGA